MGASNCPETPRQKLIGMMYLVLTALLALNVSKDILDAFGTVDETLTKTNENFERKVNSTYNQFAMAKEMQPEKAGPYYEKALIVQKHTNEMVGFINECKWEVIASTEGISLEEAKERTVYTLLNKDNKDKPQLYFLGKGGSGGKGHELQEKIENYKASLLELVDEKQRDGMSAKIGLDTKGPFYNSSKDEISWVNANFHQTILAAAVTLLNKMIGEVKNAEFDMVTHLMTAITADDFTFDQVSAKVIPVSKLVFSGSEFEADIIVAAFDSKTSPEVYWKAGIDTPDEAHISSYNKIEGDSGIVKLKIPASGMGEQKFAGFIKMLAPDGTDKFYPFSETYSVAKSQATVAAERMNVLYAGLDNPISVSAPLAPEKIRISGGGLSFRGSAGKYVVTPPANMIGKKVNITASADVGGKTQSLGGTEFRIMNVPPPVTSIGGSIRSGSHSASIIAANPFVAALTPDGFAFDLKWRVTGFTMIVGKGRNETVYSTSGPSFSAAMTSAIRSAQPGETIIIHNIKVTASVDGKAVNVNPGQIPNIGIRIR